MDAAQLTKSEKNLNNQKMKNHPPCPYMKSESKIEIQVLWKLNLCNKSCRPNHISGPSSPRSGLSFPEAVDELLNKPNLHQ